MTKLCILLLAMAAAASGAPAQEAPIKVDVDVVNVLCTVYDQRGALVDDLQKADFEILEDGRRQDIRYFARDTDLPLTVALLVDVSGSVQRFVAEEKDAAAKFLSAILRPTDQALLVGFSSTLILWQDFTSSPEQLREAVTRLRSVPFRGLPPANQPMPATLLYDGIHQTASTKLGGVSGRKAMVILSDGLDNGSQAHLPEALKAVQSTNTIVYGICYESGFSGCSFLKELAEPTGGRMFEAGKKVPLEKIFDTIQSELRSQYALGFVPQNRSHDGSFRKLRVRLRKKGFRVQARRGYYAAVETASPVK